MGFSSEVLGSGSGVSGYIFSSDAFSHSLQLEPLWGFSSAVLGFSREVLALGLGALALVQRHRIRFLALQLLDEGSCFSSGVLGLGLSSGVLRFSGGLGL